MRVFVSVDIEGVAGITGWDEARKGQPGYSAFRAQMDAEAAAACSGALAAGATDIVVKDAHGDGRNLAPSALPAPSRLIRGYNGHPFAMVQGLDETFEAVLFIGYHSRAGSGGNPLAHTLSSRKVSELRLDGIPTSELRIHTLAAGTVGVPVVLVTGDKALCAEAETLVPGCRTVAVSEGQGASTTSLHPTEAVALIQHEAEVALRSIESAPLVPQGPHRLEVEYREQATAFARSHYPGAALVDDRTIGLDVEEYTDVLRALIFLVGL